MLLSLIFLFGLCSTNNANAAGIKSKLMDELSKEGVTMSELCEFQVDNAKFGKKVITKNQATEHIEKLVEDLEPKLQSVTDLVEKMHQQQGSAESLQELASALVRFSKTVLTNELQVIPNFPSWIADEKAITLNNTECLTTFNATQYEIMSNAIDHECGRGELELDANEICGNLGKFEFAVNTVTDCQGNSSCVTTMKKRTESYIAEGLQKLKQIYTETPRGFEDEEGKYNVCVVLALGVMAADEDHIANKLAACVFEKVN